MKQTFKFLTLFLLTLLGTSNLWAKYFYLIPSNNWKEANAKFYFRYWGGSSGEGKQITTEIDNSNIFFFNDEGISYSGWQFVRVNPNKDEIWSYGPDGVSDKNLCTFNNWDGSWSGNCYRTVAGDNTNLFGDAWKADASANDMTPSANGWTLTKRATLSKGSISFKVTVDHAWETAYPSNNVTKNINSDGKYEIVFTCNGDGSKVDATITSIYTISYNANGATSGSVPTDATEYVSGSTVTVKGNTGSLAKTGYTFNGWNTKTDGTGDTYAAGTGTFSITANTTLYAKWTETKYNIAVQSNDVNMGTVASTSVQAGQITSVTLPVASVTSSTYKFVNWTATDGITITNPTSANGATIKATKAGTVTANFALAETYDLTVNKGTGIASVTGGVTGKTSIPFNQAISATLETGYAFHQWEVNSGTVSFSPNATTASVTATVSGGSATITAKAAEIIRTVNIANGTASSTTAGVATEGTATAAIAAEGKIFNGWTIPTGITLVNCTENDETITFNASADNLTVTANYRDKTLVKLYFANNNGWDKVAAYAWDDSGNNTWPGVEITSQTEEINCVTYYYFQYFSEDRNWESIIFTDGNKDETQKTGDLTIAGNNGKYYSLIESDGNGAWRDTPYDALWAFYIQKSDKSGGADHIVDCESGQATASLLANTHYIFKAHNKVTGKWYGNNNGEEANYIKGSVTNWDFWDDANDCNMRTNDAGTYTFAISQIVSSSQIKVSVTYPATETFAVTISADDNGSVEPKDEQQTDAFTGISVTATPHPGYRFKQWETSEGVSVTNPTSATTTVKATKAGTLQATFTTEGMIYFNKAGISSKWTGDVYVYFYSGPYWDDKFNPSKGSGSKTTDGGACTSGPRKMTRLGNSQIYYFDYAGAGITKESNVICFTDKSLSNADNFYQCSASYRTDFHTCANMFVPRDYIDYYNECAYYSKGYWRTFQSTDPGYDITIWNNRDGSGDQKANGDFVGTTNLSNDFTFTANLDADHTYGFKISACGGTWYGNGGTMTQDCNWEFDSEGSYTNNCGLTTTAAGEYKFTLNCTDGQLRVSVEYPLSVGDYRLAYEELDGVTITDLHPTHFIKAIKADGTKKDTVSFFVQQKANACIHLQKCTHIEGTNITWANEDSYKYDLNDFAQAAGVYNFILTQTMSESTIMPAITLQGAYAGPYYIRTDCAGGGWSSYDIADNEMTQSDILAQNTNGFDHYFVKWISANTNVKYCVANDYSEALTDSLPGDTYIGDDKQVLPQDANVRFMWNSKNNTLSRAYISGSTNISDRFLVLEGTEKMFDSQGRILTDAPSPLPKDKTAEDYAKVVGLGDYELNFADKNNWVYQADIKAQPGCAVKLTAKYNNQVQYFIGAEGTEQGSRDTIIKGTSTDVTKYTMRVVYDYKTNLLVAGWIPSDTIKSTISLGGDMLITRVHQDSAQQIIFGGDVKISDIHHVYGVLTLRKDTMTQATTLTDSVYARCIYWISFPFDVKISEIFGVDGYGTKWVIQKYNGAKRAEIGWFKETPTFWEYMGKNETMKAYEGYTLNLDPDFFQPADADVWKNSATEANFYFPSASGEIGIVQADDYEQIVLPHECKIDRTFEVQGVGTVNHKNTDSHWNVIGVPAFQNANASVVPAEGNTDFKSFYEWNKKTNGYNVRETAGSYGFMTMHAYMTQFYGTINWTKVSIVSAATAPRYAYADNKNYTIDLYFSNGVNDDHTYVKLVDEANTDFVLNEDMMKLDNAGFPNIYSFAGNYNVAYNETKMDNQSVMLGVSAPKDGTYTFSMPKEFSGTAKLIDLVEGITTDLNVSNYSVDLNKGTYNNRFQLLLEVEAKTPTSIQADGQKGREADGKTQKLLRNGNIYLINAGRVYNATGAELR